jgi:hypothetical protein
MAMTDRERILAYLRSLSPKAPTNGEIQEATGIEPQRGGLRGYSEVAGAGVYTIRVHREVWR